MKRIVSLVDIVARGLYTTRPKPWTPLDLPLYEQSNYRRKQTAEKTAKTEEVSKHNQAYEIPGRDYLTQEKR